jgi:hypothetical protein
MSIPMIGGLSGAKVEARAEAEVKSLSGYVARVIVRARIGPPCPLAGTLRTERGHEYPSSFPIRYRSDPA